MLAEKVKGLLEVLTKEADKNKKEAPVKKFQMRIMKNNDLKKQQEPETRAMVTQLKAITSKFASILKENTKIQGNLHSSIRDRVKRQVKIVDNKLSPEEVEALSENPQVIFKGQLISHIKKGISRIDTSKDIRKSTFKGVLWSGGYYGEISRDSEVREQYKLYFEAFGRYFLDG